MSLLDSFRSLELSTKDSLADLSSPLLLSLAALYLARERAGVDKLSAEHVTACLEAAGVAVTRVSVSRALARAGGKVSRQRADDGDTLYRIMTAGEREVLPKLNVGTVALFRFDGTAPRTARSKLAGVFSTLTGVVRVCDPYYGVRSLEALDSVPTTCAIHFLTARTSESQHKWHGPFLDFKKERPTTEFRVAAPKSPLHDRYLLSDECLILAGHGFKDLGAKESFLISIEKSLAPDLLVHCRLAFDALWGTATILV